MATVKQSTQAGNTKANNQNNNKVPKIRDTPDSRKNEEQEIKGDDITHNKKETVRDK